MVVFSKLLVPFSAVSCHELAHPWCSSCKDMSLGIFRSAFLESLKIYGLLYLAGGIFRKAGLKYYKYNYLLDVLRSTCFLALNAGGFAACICLLRKFLGCFCYVSTVFIPGLIASFVAILTEKKSRRSTLTLYMTNMAVETSYNMLKSRGVVTPVPNGEILLFSAATGVLMYLYRKKGGLSDGLLNSLIRYFIGQEDSEKRREIVGGSEEEALLARRKHQIHVNWIKPTFKAFVTGYLSQVVPLLLGELRLFLKTKRPGRLFRAFYNKDCLRCGIFLGSFVAVFKIVEFALGILRTTQDEFNALVAGALSGLSMMFYRSSTIALYLASKVAEVVYKRAVLCGILPDIPYGGILCYSFSTALVFHACTFEVQNVRPSYWRYLNVVTAKRFCEINRERIDEVFGTDSARLFPKDDLYRSLRRR